MHLGNFGCFDFAPEDVADDVLTVRIATSLVSQEQAQANHAAEVQGKTFDAVSTSAKAIWNELLSRVDIADVGPGYTKQQEKDILTGFYSSVYRASKYPRKLFEIDHTTNKPIHWSPYTGNTEQGVLSSDCGFWDYYRTTNSWLSMIAPDRLAEAIAKLPHCGTSLADEKGYCVDAELLYKASRKNAYDVPEGSRGRVCLIEYIKLGYIPADCSDAQVSRAMTYWHG